MGFCYGYILYICMKPLIRWTVGNVNKLGFETLRHSIGLIKSKYKDRFRYVICHNNLTAEKIGLINKMDCELIDQKNFKNSLSVESPINHGRPAWKLYPPRLSMETHEIFLDNDLILYKKFDIIEEFLQSNKIYFTEGLKRSYGKFECHIKKDMIVNTGFVGLPPNFDLKFNLEKNIKELGIKSWENHLDEQALFASVIQNFDHKMIPKIDISVCHPQLKYKKGNCGMHFIGINVGHDIHWKNYLSGSIFL